MSNTNIHFSQLKKPLTTDRLIIKELTLNDSNFILELINTEGFLKSAGNRNINSEIEAAGDIEKIISNPNTLYFVVRLKDKTKIGVISFIKRNYLDHPDIGFAFLPQFTGQGYAYEATSAVLKKLIHLFNLPQVFATTLPENISCIKLLKRLDFSFEKEMEVENMKLHFYSSSINVDLQIASPKQKRT